MTEISEQLLRVGDELQRAWHADHRRRPSTSHGHRRRLALVVALVVAALGGGVAVAAAVLKSAAEEQQGISNGHLLFTGAQPQCEALDASSFRCTVERPPTGMTFHDEEGRLLLDRYLGVKVQTVDSTRRIDGGCISIAADGRTWNCYLGERAAAQGIISADLLGHYQPEPATG